MMSSALMVNVTKPRPGRATTLGRRCLSWRHWLPREGRRGTERVDVRAFTGKAKFCKKFAAGFSNCCKDSGWGQDVGLARCSSEEKALAKAKRQADGQYREFCSKRFWDLPGEKELLPVRLKTGADRSAAGRNGQLHIGFGGASSPDCRGLRLKSSRGSTLTCLISPILWTT
uniref:Conjugal transfer mating pair stabilization protein TraN n=1 Tax=Klebsiella pneumoniae TaxID=573 RepID=A0A2P1BNT2_KLEPN|nr:conjugal transfer mating pair stabilization protein TraN [Klebsiella pneumoniae]